MVKFSYENQFKRRTFNDVQRSFNQIGTTQPAPWRDCMAAHPNVRSDTKPYLSQDQRFAFAQGDSVCNKGFSHKWWLSEEGVGGLNVKKIDSAWWS